VSRGDVLVPLNDAVEVTDRIHASVCWLGNEPLSLKRRYWLKHLTRNVRATVERVDARYDIETLARTAIGDDDTITLAKNDIGELIIRTAQPLVADAFENSRATGRFILIDDATNATVAAGTILAGQ
jgi:sulfate adenylyltransferase subunit 1 (EFTu-like GTPase family)